MNGKKIAAALVLIVIVVVAGLFIKRQFTSSAKMPEWKAGEQVTKIDMNTLEVVTLPLSDWLEKYPADWRNRYKNPKTGKNTMVEVTKCGACGAQIPVQQFSDEHLKMMKSPPEEDPGRPYREEEKLRLEYKCPKCGKNPNATPFGGHP